jgi:plastocyanin
MEPSMTFMQDAESLQMFKGAPATGNYPAEPESMEMEGMSMEGIMVDMVAKPDQSNNYHFMPHVAWVEPGTTVIWAHADIDGVSEPRAHSVTSFGAANYFPSFISPGAQHFDSGYIPGLHGQKSVPHGIDHRFNERLSNLLESHGNPLRRGPFMHTFEHEGVYLYYCQNHHGFKMAAAVVVGELWGDDGTESVDDPNGWSPAMTRDTEVIAQVDDFHGEPLRDQVHELREMIQRGGEMMGGH